MTEGEKIMLGKALDNLVELISSINGEIKELRSQLSERSHSGEAPTGNTGSPKLLCVRECKSFASGYGCKKCYRNYGDNMRL